MIVPEITVSNEALKQFYQAVLRCGLEVMPLELNLQTESARRIGHGIYLIANPKSPNNSHKPIAYADFSHQYPYISDVDNKYSRPPTQKEQGLLGQISSELGFRRIRL